MRPPLASLATALLTAACALGLALAPACRQPEPFDPLAAWPPPARGAIVSEHPLASQVGLDVLERGGNAVDAGVAAALALAVVLPRAGNLGGGGFAVVVPHTGEPYALDFRESAPAAARPSLYLDAQGRADPERSRRGPLSVAVPGSPAGLWTLWRRWGSGRISFQQLAAPAIDLAREGFAVDAALAADLARDAVARRFNAAARAVFLPGGRPLREGELLRQPALARTLERFAAHGPDGFYAGATAEAIVQSLGEESHALGLDSVWMKREDLARYSARELVPLRGWYRGNEIITVPPPSSGGVIVLQALGIFEGLPIDAERERVRDARRLAGAQEGDPVMGPRLVHWLIESLRLGFADRARWMGDPSYVAVPVGALLAPETIATRRVSIGDRADPGAGPWTPALESDQTTHLSVLDREGTALSLTTTLNASFGSGLLVRDAGFLLNDEMDDFSLGFAAPNLYGLVGGEANAIEPGKRPLSSMTPTVVREGGQTVTLVLGSPGGPRIPTAVLQVLLRVLALGQDLESAVAAPRLHQQWRPPATEFEPGWDPELLGALTNRHGQEVVQSDERFGSVQAIWVPVPGAVPVVASDPRASGAGYVEREPVQAPAR